MDLARFHAGRKLGRQKSPHDQRTLKMAKYLPATLPVEPDVFDWSTKMTDIGSMGNLTYGDCGIAAPGHAEQSWSSLTETQQIIIPDDQILQAYSDVSGFKPGDPSTDTGVDMLSVCKYWRGTGVGGRQIRAFASIDKGDDKTIGFCTWAFGGLYGGLALPLSCQNQLLWTYTPGGTNGDPTPNSWGGHAIWIVGRDKIRRTIKFVSWGALMEMTYEFWDVYGDESYACLSSGDWAEQNVAPSGIDLATLDADVQAVAA
jgi:hypothetical protein